MSLMATTAFYVGLLILAIALLGVGMFFMADADLKSRTDGNIWYVGVVLFVGGIAALIYWIVLMIQAHK